MPGSGELDGDPVSLDADNPADRFELLAFPCPVDAARHLNEHIDGRPNLGRVAVLAVFLPGMVQDEDRGAVWGVRPRGEGRQDPGPLCGIRRVRDRMSGVTDE